MPTGNSTPRTFIPFANTGISKNIVNLVANSSFEGPVTGSQTWDLQAPIFTQVTGIAGSFGVRCVKDAYTHVSDHTNDFANFNTSNTQAAAIPVQPNTVYTVSCWAIINVSVGLPPHIDVNATDAFTTTLAGMAFTVTPAMTWQRFSETFNSGNNTKVWIRVWNNDSGLTDAAVCYFDAFQLEVGSVATPYFDGDSGQGYAWNGAPYAQGVTSTRYANVQRVPV